MVNENPGEGQNEGSEGEHQGGEGEGTQETEHKTLTQEEVNRLMAAEKRKTKAAEKQVTDLTSRIEALENEKLSDDEKAKKAFDEKQKELQDREAKIQREESWAAKRGIGEKAGLSQEITAAIRTISESDDPEELADAYLAISEAVKAGGAHGATPGGTGGSTPPNATYDEKMDKLKADRIEAMKSGDRMEVERISNQIVSLKLHKNDGG